MSVYIDTITFIWASCLLFAYAPWVIIHRSPISLLGFSAIVTYLIAQSGWTTAFLLGDVWGRDLSNYIWFIFNSIVFCLLSVIWYRNERGSVK
jgi:hypothetical protein